MEALASMWDIFETEVPLYSEARNRAARIIYSVIIFRLMIELDSVPPGE